MGIILNNQQKKAVKTGSRKALCLAGAGAGKTRVLIERIADLIENKNVSPYEICSFTFTRLAAKEMIDRLEKRIGHQAKKITVGTIHAIALNHIQKYGELLGLRPGKITVYNTWEADFLLKDTAKELGHHNGHAWTGVKKKDVYKVLNAISSGDLDFDLYDYPKETEIINAFFARCHENNAMTYDSILSTFLMLLPQIKEYLGFKHVFLDECQDNSPIQWTITNMICKFSDASLFATGDDSQSLYFFRGADPEYIIRNQSSFDIFKLQKNYRSDANIVTAANNLIRHNKNRLDLEMISVKPGLIPVEKIENIDSRAICAALPIIAKNRTAVLSRNHYLLEKLSGLMDQAGIKHEYLGKKTKLAHSKEFRRFHAFLKLIVNPYDNFAFLLIKEFLVDQDQYMDIRIMASEEGKSHFQIWSQSWNEESWKEWLKCSEKTDFATVIDFMKDIKFDFETEPIFDFIYTWQLDNYDGTIDQYLNWLTTYDIQDEIKKEPEKIQLMTVHAAKGLEWPTVIIAGLNEGILPDKREIKTDPNVESERRVAYVAMTRAENQLILTSRPIKKDLFEIKNLVSRFVEEVLHE